MAKSANHTKAEPAFVPAISLDPMSVSEKAFQSSIDGFWETTKNRIADGSVAPMPFDHDGWYDVTPKMGEAALMHSAGNREISLTAIRALAYDLKAAMWKRTGESVSVSQGKLFNGHHRMFTTLLTGLTMPLYVVTTVPYEDNMFAFYDQGKKRSGGDVLSIAGWNGASKIISKAIETLAVRYDHDALGISRNPSFQTIRQWETLAYMKEHPDFEKAAHLMLGTYPDAVNVIRSKPVAVFFAWKVIEAYDKKVLENFCTPLGNGANLDVDSPLLAVRAKLISRDDPTSGKRRLDRTTLAYLNMAFMMWVTNQTMPRARRGLKAVLPLELDLERPFPKITGNADEGFAEAAE
jgi:hypothetical protein